MHCSLELLPYVLKVPDRVLRSELADSAAHALRLRPELVRDEVRRALRQGHRSEGMESAAPVLEASRVCHATI